MRLTTFEVAAIKQSAQEVFGSKVEVFLFGSRVDDEKRGGDIDLYIKTQTGKDLTHKIKFLVSLEQKIGEQKIDVVLAIDENRPIEQQAMRTGVML
ncbi:MAG: nucleotidyltransferase domain-containing protein [Rhodocyclaceae bacterium]|nr:nucleotidyltransferase domain-containing protein [Rhodocyclaceae bacterium]